jgi:beta-carotene 3-hydroxylase
MAMNSTLLFALVVLAVFLFMEFVAWFTHKFVMHGFLWSLHKSHHRPRALDDSAGLELNDWFGVFFSIVATGFFVAGATIHSLYLAAGLGMTAYGLAYLFLHDILAHKRFGIRIHPKSGYLRNVLRSHRVHHARRTKEGCVSFGFLVPMRKGRGY